jgi:Protein of unknown function (DUF4054)
MSPADFIAAFPEFASESEARISALMALAGPYFDVARWGAFYSAGLGNFVAHRLATQNAGRLGADATTTEERVGELSAATDVKVALDDPFLTTQYGREYRMLANMIGAGGTVANMIGAGGTVAW